MKYENQRDLRLEHLGRDVPNVPRVLASIFARRMPCDGVVYNGEFYNGSQTNVHPVFMLAGDYSGKRPLGDEDVFALRRGIHQKFGSGNMPRSIITPANAQGLTESSYHLGILLGLPHDSDTNQRKAA